MTLVEFLEARIAEDEAGAHAAGGQEWYPVLLPPPAMRRTPDEETHWSVDSPASLVSYEVTSRDKAGHIADWSPARVLTECEAKREIAKLHRLGTWPYGEPDRGLRLLALPYADHPDYLEEWKP